MSYIPTQRTFKNVLNGEQYRLYMHSETKQNKLISESTGTEASLFYPSSFSQSLKLKNGLIVSLNPGDFLPFDTTNPPTHRKTELNKRFVKI